MEMETKLPLSDLQEILATCCFYIKVHFISLVNPPCEEVYSERSQASRTECSACTDNVASGLGMQGMSRGIKIKGNERIRKNIVSTFWYEK